IPHKHHGFPRGLGHLASISLPPMATGDDRFAPLVAGLVGNSLATRPARRPSCARRLPDERSDRSDRLDRFWRPVPRRDRTCDPLIERAETLGRAGHNERPWTEIPGTVRRRL